MHLSFLQSTAGRSGGSELAGGVGVGLGDSGAAELGGALDEPPGEDPVPVEEAGGLPAVPGGTVPHAPSRRENPIRSTAAADTGTDRWKRTGPTIPRTEYIHCTPRGTVANTT
ncbi:hypothetical protein GCM10028864_50260 [Microlunatus parietis]